MKVAFLDLRVTEEQERRELLESVDEVLRHGRIILGPEVEEFEQRVAERCGRRFAVGVGSGTDALILGLKSIGVGAGDEVITTPLSWIATANSIAINGATPVFADIDDDLNINPASIEPLITSRTKAILPVHFTGKLCRMSEIIEIADKHGLTIVEDCAQAFDADYEGRRAGSFGKIGCFSMNSMKVFAACGEAGVIVMDAEDLHERLISLRSHGTINREFCHELSHNARIDTLQAAILLKRLSRLNKVIARRREIATYYNSRFDGLVGIPKAEKGYGHVYYTYTIRANRRDELVLFLKERGIETKIQHPLLMPHQPIYKDTAPGGFPKADRIVKEILCLPANEKITDRQREYVANRVIEFYQEAK